jgi:hypothetical protein
MRAAIKGQLSIFAEGSGDFVNSTQRVVLIDGLNKSATLNDVSGTPLLEGEPVDLSHTLASADDELDLTAAPVAHRPGATVDLTGKRLIAMQLFAPADNAGTITLKEAAADGYPIGDGIDLEPGEVITIGQVSKVSTRATVASTRRYLTIAGTSADELQILAVWGDS